MSEMPPQPTREFDANHFRNLLETAYSNRNYSEAYRYATSLIENSPPRTYPFAWIYKGLSAGMLSTLESLRIEEMQSYIRTALEIDPSSINGLPIDVAAEASYMIYSLTWVLFGQLLNTQQVQSQNYAASQVQPTVVVTGKSIADTVGAGIGAGIGRGWAQSMIQSKEARLIAIRQGDHFYKTYQSQIINGLEFAWSIGTGEQVAANIFETAKIIAGTEAINPIAKQNAINRLMPLLGTIIQSYPTYKYPQAIDSGYIMCPSCGYSFISRAGWEGACLDIALFFMTGGLWLLYLMFLKKPSPIKIGDKVNCNTCNYEWIYQG